MTTHVHAAAQSGPLVAAAFGAAEPKGNPLYEISSVVALPWTSFYGAASSRPVGGTRLVATQASANSASDDALTSWESEGGSLRQASREPSERENFPGSEQQSPPPGINARGDRNPFVP